MPANNLKVNRKNKPLHIKKAQKEAIKRGKKARKRETGSTTPGFTGN